MGQTLPAFIESRRDALGLTQADLAEAAGVSESYVSHIEAGRYTLTRPQTIERFASALQVPREDMYRAAGRAIPEPSDMATSREAPPTRRPARQDGKRFSSFLRKRMDELGMSRTDLADATQRSESYIRHLETGRTVPIRPETIMEIALALAVPPDVVYIASGQVPPDVAERVARYITTPEQMHALRQAIEEIGTEDDAGDTAGEDHAGGGEVPAMIQAIRRLR